MVSSLTYRERGTARSSFCSRRMAPTRRTMACSLRRSNGLELCSLASVGRGRPATLRLSHLGLAERRRYARRQHAGPSTGWDSEATAPQALVDLEFDLTVTGVCLAEVDLTLDRAGDAAPATLDRSADASPTMDGRLHGDLSAAALTDGPAYRIVWTCQPRCEPPPCQPRALSS